MGRTEPNAPVLINQQSWFSLGEQPLSLTSISSKQLCFGERCPSLFLDSWFLVLSAAPTPPAGVVVCRFPFLAPCGGWVTGCWVGAVGRFDFRRFCAVLIVGGRPDEEN